MRRYRRDNGCVIVTFYEHIAESEITSYFEQYGLDGVRVSTLKKRYAVEVPTGKEEHWKKTFQDNLNVEDVCSQVIEGYKKKSYKR